MSETPISFALPLARAGGARRTIAYADQIELDDASYLQDHLDGTAPLDDLTDLTSQTAPSGRPASARALLQQIEDNPGPQGPQGPIGAVGPAGPQGIQGPQGPQGPAGATGSQGPVGPQGPTGATGPQGPSGETFSIIGTLASQGDLPPTGTTGDMYIINGDGWTWDAANTQWENIGRIQGPQGDAGPQGPAGPAGAQGASGPQGPQGAEGPQGPPGATGPQGPAGASNLKTSSTNLAGTDDLNTQRTEGLFAWTTQPVNGPGFANGVLLVMSETVGSGAVQIAMHRNASPSVNSFRVRAYDGTTWSGWDTLMNARRLAATTDGSSGADAVGATSIPNVPGSTTQAILESLATLILARPSSTALAGTDDGSSGADAIGVTGIAGLLSGANTTLQPLLEAMKTLVDGKTDIGSVQTLLNSVPLYGGSDDLNDIKTTSFGRISMSTSNTPANAPPANGQTWYTLLTVGSTFSAFQLAVSFNGSPIYTRSLSGSNWSGWSQMPTAPGGKLASNLFDFATEAEAKAGTDASKPANALRVFQAIDQRALPVVVSGPLTLTTEREILVTAAAGAITVPSGLPVGHTIRVQTGSDVTETATKVLTFSGGELINGETTMTCDFPSAAVLLHKTGSAAWTQYAV